MVDIGPVFNFWDVCLPAQDCSAHASRDERAYFVFGLWPGWVEKVKAEAINFSACMQSSRLRRPKSIFKSGKETVEFQLQLETCQCIWIQTRSANHQILPLCPYWLCRADQTFGTILVWLNWFWAYGCCDLPGTTGHANKSLLRHIVCIATLTCAVHVLTADPYFKLSFSPNT